MKTLKILLPLLTNAFAFGMIVLVILDRYNPYQNFLNSASSRVYMLIFSALCLVTSGLLLYRVLKENHKQ